MNSNKNPIPKDDIIISVPRNVYEGDSPLTTNDRILPYINAKRLLAPDKNPTVLPSPIGKTLSHANSRIIGIIEMKNKPTTPMLVTTKKMFLVYSMINTKKSAPRPPREHIPI